MRLIVVIGKRQLLQVHKQITAQCMDDALPDLSHHLNLESEYEHNYYRHGKHQTARNDDSL